VSAAADHLLSTASSGEARFADTGFYKSPD